MFVFVSFLKKKTTFVAHTVPVLYLSGFLVYIFGILTYLTCWPSKSVSWYSSSVTWHTTIFPFYVLETKWNNESSSTELKILVLQVRDYTTYHRLQGICKYCDNITLHSSSINSFLIANSLWPSVERRWGTLLYFLLNLDSKSFASVYNEFVLISSPVSAAHGILTGFKHFLI